jgi:uncharacterized protein YjbI with pentapeptide repeats
VRSYSHSDEFRRADFSDLDMSGARFREVDLTGARMRGVHLVDADLDGVIAGLMVNGVEVTPRHLIFVSDAWLGHAVGGRSGPFHPIGLPADFTAGAEAYGIDTRASPRFDDVMGVRREQDARVRAFLAEATQGDLDRIRDANPSPGWPPEPRSAD